MKIGCLLAFIRALLLTALCSGFDISFDCLKGKKILVVGGSGRKFASNGRPGFGFVAVQLLVSARHSGPYRTFFI